MLKRFIFLLPLILAFGWSTAVQALGEPLDPAQAFRFSARALDTHTIEARWKIAEGYYLYRDKFRFEIEPETIKPGLPQFPPGKFHDDDNFGKVEIYRDEVSIRLPVETAFSGSLTLKVRSQGCADILT
mgnify:FL=1